MQFFLRPFATMRSGSKRTSAARKWTQLSIGQMVGEISAKLSSRVNTTSNCRAIALRKLNLDNNAQIVQFALEHDWILKAVIVGR